MSSHYYLDHLKEKFSIVLQSVATTHSRTMMRIISGPLKKNTSFITGEFGSLVTAHPAQLMIIH